MRKFLFFVMSLPFFLFGQELVNDNFDGYAAGQVASDVGGEMAGASGYYIYATAGQNGGTSTNIDANMAEFATANGSQGIKLNGPNGSNGAAFVWKDGLNTSWASRTSGNDQIKISFDFTLLSDAGQNAFSVELYNSDYSKVLVGFQFSASNKQIIGVATGSSGTVGVFLGADAQDPSTAEMCTLNQSSTYTMYYSKSDGRVRWEVNGNTYDATGAAMGIDPAEVDFITYAGSTSSSANATSDSGLFDNLVVNAIGNLGVEDVAVNNEVSVLYPNPVKDSFKMNLSSKFNTEATTLTITDMNGKQVMVSPYAESVNVSNLASGVYMITISDGENTENQKLIKQ